MGFIEQLKIKAKSNKKTIVLPEGMDRRTYRVIPHRGDGFGPCVAHRHEGAFYILARDSLRC